MRNRLIGVARSEMKTKRVVTVISLFIVLGVIPLSAQEWSPSRIVGIDYPTLAIQARIKGTVKVKCVLDADGKVLSTELLEVVGSKGTRDLLGTAAQRNALQWTFSRSNSATQQSRVTVITYDFDFEVKPNPDYLKSRFVFDFPQSVHVVAEVPTIQITK
jgi:TonB family protein